MSAERYLRRLIDRLPGGLAGALHALRRPRRRWLRRGAAMLLLLGGLLWFLPLLGFWMLPLGLLLLADDMPSLRRLLVSALRRGAIWRWRCRRRPTTGRQSEARR